MKKIALFLVPVVLLITALFFLTNFKVKKPESISFLSEKPPVLIDSTEDMKALGFSGQKKIAQDSKGNIFVAFRKKFNEVYEIFVVRIKKNGFESKLVNGKGEPITNVSGAHQRNPSIAIDKKDNIHVVWYGAQSQDKINQRQIKYSNSQNQGHSWSEWINISLVEGYKGESLWQEHPDIIAARNGDLYVVWEGRDKDNEKQQIKLSKSSDLGKTWSEWKNIQPTLRSAQSRPTILEDSKNRLHVFMYSSQNSSIHQIWYSSSSDKGETWSKWKNISRSLVDSRHVSAAIDSKDRIYVVWRQPSGIELLTQIYYSVLDNNQWSRPTLVHSSSTFQFFPSIGVDVSDNIYASWMEASGSSNFPNDDPKIAHSYLAFYDEKTKSFKVKKLINKLSNTYYPVISPHSREEKQILVGFLEENRTYEIYLVAKEAVDFR